MTDLIAALADYGIRPKSFTPGNSKTTCPKCSHARRDKKDPCLSVTLDPDGGAVWNCHNCGWSDNVPSSRNGNGHRQDCRPSRLSPTPARIESATDDLPQKVIAWFTERGISEATLKRNGIRYGPSFIPAAGEEVNCIQFPYRRNGEVVNIKFRDGQKRFAQVKGAEKIFFGLDDITGQETIIVTEGELDKLALEEAGYLNAVSVPDGAPAKVGPWPKDPEEDRKFEFLWNCRDELAGAKKIILALDGDGPGQALTEELARRLGRERCWRVTWPSLGDVLCKDANEVLIHHEAKVLCEVVENAQPYPIKSLYEIGAYESEGLALFRDGPKRSFSMGWQHLDEFATIREGELSVVTGIPGAGKSEFVDAVMMNLAQQFGWRFAVCSFENPPAEHIAKLVEKRLGKPFWPGPTPRMSEDEYREGVAWLNDHFYLIRADDESPTIDWILETARGAVLRYGIRGLVIDPYNEIEHKRPANMNETEYVGQVLGKVKRFAQAHGVHVWFVAHPTKMHRESGKIPVPTLYDISASAHWANKCDLGIVVHRERFDGDDHVDVHVKKVRFKAVGKPGKVTLRYDKPTGRYFEAA